MIYIFLLLFCSLITTYHQSPASFGDIGRYSPVEEMATLRTGVLDSHGSATLGPTNVTLNVKYASDIVVYLTAPTSATTISVAIGDGSVFLDYTPAPALAAETMSPWTCNVGFSAGGKSKFSDVVPLLADDNTLKIQVCGVWHRA
jgi:hypothetical protein